MGRIEAEPFKALRHNKEANKQKGELKMEKTLKQMLEDDERERREFHTFSTRWEKDKEFQRMQLCWIYKYADSNNLQRQVVFDMWVQHKCPDLTTREGRGKLAMLIDNWFSADLL